MPRRKEVTNQIGTDIFCLQVYDPFFDFKIFDPSRTFEKWAAVEVPDFTSIPKEMEAFTLQGGLYAVFLHRGAAATGATTFRYIFETWLPNSDYSIDDRPHFEILGSKYKNNDPSSEEDIWIPVQPKSKA
jgi:AraC family transcriptional regulator